MYFLCTLLSRFSWFLTTRLKLRSFKGESCFQVSRKIHVLVCTLKFFLQLKTSLSASLKPEFTLGAISTETADKPLSHVLSEGFAV